tara:strand:+ start:240 stop:464 length:225 start_codon:yes stop_codon:yes gene_type:complete
MQAITNGSQMTTKKENPEKLTNLDFNEYLVQSKLEPELFKKFYSWLQVNKLNRSSGLKKILNTFFSSTEIKNND